MKTAILGCLLLALSCCAIVSAEYQEIRLTNSIGTESELDAAVDGAGHIHLVYERGGGVYYRSSSGIEALVANGSQPALAVSSSGTPHVAFLADGGARYTALRDGTWTTPAALAGAGASGIDVAERAGRVAIAYTAQGSDGYSDLLCAVAVNETPAAPVVVLDGKIQNYYRDECSWWTCHQVWTGSDSWNYYIPAIAFDGSGQYQVAARVQSTYQSSGYSSSMTEIIEAAENGGTRESGYLSIREGHQLWFDHHGLAVDDSNRVHVAYTHLPPYTPYERRNVRHAVFTTAWSGDGVIGTGVQSALASMGGVTGIAYTGSDGNLTYAEDAGAGWSTPGQQVGAGIDEAVVALGRFPGNPVVYRYLFCTKTAPDGDTDAYLYTDNPYFGLPPSASFIANATVGPAPLAIAFTDTSTNSPTNWSWDFGDGTNATVQHPTHIYTANGTYTVRLTAANGAGSSESNRTITVSSVPATQPPPPTTMTPTPSMPTPTANASTEPTTVPTTPVPSTPTIPINATETPTPVPNGTTIVPTVPAVTMVIGGSGTPTNTDGDSLYDDVNGNGRADFADVVLYFNQMTWIAGNEPVAAFDYNGNGRIDFADVVWLFNHL
ncbi:MAG: PKD domain-containing protein [Methanospirillum sp.]